ncbi:RING finger domain-containing protein [Endozoicomonas sp. 4G]|uniref:RING finger domain-containing protein n=1 Tax=Endozoicomonas sp. 4G TaxID=2872754 RepID=UPI002078A8C9|nr:RING finger domain-containing protein [Endozoicomonas sp. 4G]
MKSKFKVLVRLIFLSITLSFCSEVCSSGYEEPDESEVTTEYQKLWSYVPVDYYMGRRGVLRLTLILTIGFLDGYHFYLNRAFADKISHGFSKLLFLLMPLNFGIDLSEELTTSSNNDIAEIKVAMGLPFLELKLWALSENSTLYNISKPLFNLGVSSIVFTSSQIDDEIHLLGELKKIGESDKVLFDISFPELDPGSYHWVELCCNKDAGCNTSSSVPLSVLSEEVVNELAVFLNGSDGFLESTSHFKRVKGIDFSVSEEFVVAKIKQEGSNIVSYSICDTQTHTLQLKNSHLRFSNQMLVFELEKRLSVIPEGWFQYIIKLFFKPFEYKTIRLFGKQLEYFVFALMVENFFGRMFPMQCGICHESVSAATVSLASCSTHYFCNACLKRWARRRGSRICPYCER